MTRFSHGISWKSLTSKSISADRCSHAREYTNAHTYTELVTSKWTERESQVSTASLERPVALRYFLLVLCIAQVVQTLHYVNSFLWLRIKISYIFASERICSKKSYTFNSRGGPYNRFTDGGEVVSLTHRLLWNTERSWHIFLSEAESTPRP
jgi:hypothetical protein